MYQLNWNKLPINLSFNRSLLNLKICTNIIRDKQKQPNYSYLEYLNQWFSQSVVRVPQVVRKDFLGGTRVTSIVFIKILDLQLSGILFNGLCF